MNVNEIKEKVKNVPLSPGVYIMRNADGEVIYVGKSKALKNRVSQYFMNLKSHTPKTDAMVSHICDFDYIMTDSEAEALILECNLIKKYKPRYNILLKDDKHYPYIKITLNEKYPRIFMTRKLIYDGGKYFGPYMNTADIRNVLELIKKIFKVRSCSKKIEDNKKNERPCLYYHIGQCSAPCSYKISADEYRKSFDEISDLLEGKYKKIIGILKEKMIDASDKFEYERAARYRDSIESIKMLGEKQKMISTSDDNRDIIGIYRKDSESCICIFYMRNGKMQGSEHFVFDNAAKETDALLPSFMKQYYSNATNIPKEILVPEFFDEKDDISGWLSDKTGHKITITLPKRGEKLKTVNMVCKNAEEALKQHHLIEKRKVNERNKVLSELTEVLGLQKVPHRIESYDISNISGESSVGVCVVYKNSIPSKKDYRKFNIKTVSGADDYESTREVIARRINRAYTEIENIDAGTLTKEQAKFLPLPDLILLDGGKGHVKAIRTLMETLGEEIPVFGLVKDDKHRTRALVDENKEYAVNPDGTLFCFLSDIQEEVHRFAITSFRGKKEKAFVASELELIPGIGKAKRQKLLREFTNIRKIKTASVDELSSVLDERSAESVYKYFHKQEK